MNIMDGVFIMIGLFVLGNDICRAAQTIADAIRAAHGIYAPSELKEDT